MKCISRTPIEAKDFSSSPEVSKPGGPQGAVGPVGGLFVWVTFILNEIWAQDKINILVGTYLVEIFYLTYHVLPVLTPNYKQYILLPAKLEKYIIH
jgi:hypothetical protein